MKQHTSGPWRTVVASAQFNPDTLRRDIIGKCEFGDAFVAGDISQEDARLIAAAPDLLAVLSAIVADYHALQRSQGASASLGAEFTAGEWIGSRLGGHIAQAESFLSKAKGEA